VHRQDLHRLVTQRAGWLVARQQHRADEAVQTVEDRRHRRIRPPKRIQHADVARHDALAAAADLQAAEQPGFDESRGVMPFARRIVEPDQPGLRPEADRGIPLDRDASLERHDQTTARVPSARLTPLIVGGAIFISPRQRAMCSAKSFAALAIVFR
jgi:hypothetical protein